MKRFEVFESCINSDSIEGRGPMAHVGYFTFIEDANRSVSGRVAYEATVNPVVITIYDDYEEFSDALKQLREKALASLLVNKKIDKLKQLNSAKRLALGLSLEDEA